MDNRSGSGTILITCGTLLVASALVLVGYQMSLASADVRDHRAQSSNILRDSSIERVTLSEWEPPSMAIAWVAVAGGFALAGLGIRQGATRSSPAKLPQRDEFE